MSYLNSLSTLPECFPCVTVYFSTNVDVLVGSQLPKFTPESHLIPLDLLPCTDTSPLAMNVDI